ncbi:hypothetical protein PENSPDRAFT_687740 [Peniophora sp. CONT]|nr:hypothetical protein PENSPDRAFT_687740 [Peniophora sp. CONT]
MAETTMDKSGVSLHDTEVPGENHRATSADDRLQPEESSTTEIEGERAQTTASIGVENSGSDDSGSSDSDSSDDDGGYRPRGNPSKSTGSAKTKVDPRPPKVRPPSQPEEKFVTQGSTQPPSQTRVGSSSQPNKR